MRDCTSFSEVPTVVRGHINVNVCTSLKHNVYVCRTAAQVFELEVFYLNSHDGVILPAHPVQLSAAHFAL